MSDYEEHYAIQARLATEESLLAAVRLFDLDAESLYSAGMDLLASSLPSGRESPFSNKATGSNHSILMSALCHQIEVLGYEVNLMLDRAWINFYRLLGVEQLTGSYPLLEMEFSRSIDALRNGIDVIIPIGTEIRNTNNPSLSARTIETITISGSDLSATVAARVDTLGVDLNTAIGSYTQFVGKTAFLESCRDLNYIEAGADVSSLAEAIQIARSGIRTGNLGRLTDKGLIDLDGDAFLGRCVTLRDYIFYARRLGAKKANAVQGIAFGASGYYGDLITVPIYPPGVSAAVKVGLLKISDASARVDVIPAVVVPIDGIINIKIAQNLTRKMAIDLITTTIVDTINPPFGMWGDPNLSSSISTAIERIQGIYAVPSIFLKHAESGIPLEGLEVSPWHLFEIQDTIQFNVV